MPARARVRLRAFSVCSAPLAAVRPAYGAAPKAYSVINSSKRSARLSCRTHALCHAAAHASAGSRVPETGATTRHIRSASPVVGPVVFQSETARTSKNRRNKTSWAEIVAERPRLGCQFLDEILGREKKINKIKGKKMNDEGDGTDRSFWGLGCRCARNSSEKVPADAECAVGVLWPRRGPESATGLQSVRCMPDCNVRSTTTEGRTLYCVQITTVRSTPPFSALRTPALLESQPATQNGTACKGPARFHSEPTHWLSPSSACPTHQPPASAPSHSSPPQEGLPGHPAGLDPVAVWPRPTWSRPIAIDSVVYFLWSSCRTTESYTGCPEGAAAVCFSNGTAVFSEALGTGEVENHRLGPDRGTEYAGGDGGMYKTRFVLCKFPDCSCAKWC